MMVKLLRRKRTVSARREGLLAGQIFVVSVREGGKEVAAAVANCRREIGSRTKDELFQGREDVHAEGDLDLVLLQVQPLAEGLEGRHFVVFLVILR